MKTVSILILAGFGFLMNQCSMNTSVEVSNGSFQKDQKEQEVIKQWDGKKVSKSDSAWMQTLTDDEFYILRQAGTERAFTGDLYANKTEGMYSCAACGLLLFSSDTKFTSGTGWPSFYQPEGKDHVGEKVDSSHGWTRTEVVCNRCDGHLGHVFSDGPAPTGLRYCINSASLDFQGK